MKTLEFIKKELESKKIPDNIRKEILIDHENKLSVLEISKKHNLHVGIVWTIINPKLQ